MLEYFIEITSNKKMHIPAVAKYKQFSQFFPRFTFLISRLLSSNFHNIWSHHASNFFYPRRNIAPVRKFFYFFCKKRESFKEQRQGTEL